MKFHDLEDEAADWVVKRSKGLSNKEKLTLDARIAEEPKLYLEIVELEKAQNLIRQLPLENARKVLAESDSFDCSITQKHEHRIYRLILPSIAVTVLLTFSLFFFIWNTKKDKVHSITSLETPITHILEDGSIVRLNTNTSLVISYSSISRELELEQGEAHFTVQKDIERPFQVLVGNVEVRAIGTAFNILKSAETINVTITEGTVIINDKTNAINNFRSEAPENSNSNLSLTELGPVNEGQSVSVSLNQDLLPTHFELTETAPNMIEDLEWHSSLLMLEGGYLKDIAATFEQKTGRKLIIQDTEVADFRIAGRFPSDDVYGFLRVLNEAYGIIWKETDDLTIYLSSD